MLANGVTGTGISAHKRSDDLSDFAAELDMIEALGVEAIELPTYDMDIVVGGRIRQPQLEALKRACAGRDVVYSVHGPLAINFMDRGLPPAAPFRGARSLAGSGGRSRRRKLRHPFRPDADAAGRRASKPLTTASANGCPEGGDVARGHGLILCVETLFAGFDGEVHASSPSRLAAELAADRPSERHGDARFQPCLPQARFRRPPRRLSSKRSRRWRRMRNTCTSMTVSAARTTSGCSPRASGWPTAMATCICRSAGATFRGRR